MKIGILTNTFPPSLNGVSVSVNSLQQRLSELGHQVFIATPKIENQVYSDNFFPIPSIKVPEGISQDLKLPYLYAEKVADFFLNKEIEILHTHDTIIGGIEGAYIADSLGIPCVHTFHTMIQDYDYFDFPGYQAFIQRYIKEVLNSYDHIITPSEKTYTYLLSIGIHSPISKIHNVINFENTKANEKQIQISELKKEDFVLLSFSRLAKEKNLDLAIDLVKPLFLDYPNLKFLIAGDGPDKQRLQKKVQDLGLVSKIIFFGRYERNQLKAICKQAQAFLFTSFTENLPTNILEAMYFGLPVLAVKDVSVDYLLKDQENGFKGDTETLQSCIKELIQNSDLLKRLSKNAKQIANDFVSQDRALEHLQLYQRTLQIFQENQSRLQSQAQNRIFEMQALSQFSERLLDKLKIQSSWQNLGKHSKNFYTKYLRFLRDRS